MFSFLYTFNAVLLYIKARLLDTHPMYKNLLHRRIFRRYGKFLFSITRSAQVQKK